ncbi:MAG: hypothetical protein IIC22_00445 [Chloroflexi bacterium]|nr:hypothetical protein [Chloroflexota bacterium]
MPTPVGRPGASSHGFGDGEFDLPAGIAVNGAGNVYVADRWNGRVQVFDSNGNFLAKWDLLGEGESQFVNPFAGPMGIAVDESGKVYVIDSGNVQIMVFQGMLNR